jgi:hypothetical protein
MSKKTSFSVLQMFRYGVTYTERYFKFAWNQTFWVWKQGEKYLTWVKGQNIHPGLQVVLYFFLIGLPLLWICILIWGFVRSI